MIILLNHYNKKTLQNAEFFNPNSERTKHTTQYISITIHIIYHLCIFVNKNTHNYLKTIVYHTIILITNT